jgi:hypothetical protein
LLVVIAPLNACVVDVDLLWSAELSGRGTGDVAERPAGNALVGDELVADPTPEVGIAAADSVVPGGMPVASTNSMGALPPLVSMLTFSGAFNTAADSDLVTISRGCVVLPPSPPMLEAPDPDP